MPVDYLVVLIPFALVVVLTIFCIVALCKHFCQADTTKEETVPNRSTFSTNLQRENFDLTDSRTSTCSNNSILVSSDKNQIPSSVSASNNIPTTTDYSVNYNMPSNRNSNSFRSNVFSRSSSGLEWLNIPPRVSINHAREINNSAASILRQNADLYTRVPNVYSHGAIYESFNRNLTESANSSVRRNAILADPRNYGDDTVYSTSSYASSMTVRDSTSSDMPLRASVSDERERNNRTSPILPQSESLFSRVPSLYSHGAVFDSFYRNNTALIRNSILTDPRNYGDDTIYPIGGYESSMASRGSTSSDVTLNVSINDESERRNGSTSISLRNDLCLRVPSSHFHDSPNRNNAEAPNTFVSSSDNLEDTRTIEDDSSNAFSIATTSGSTVRDLPPQASTNGERERSSTSASTVLQNEILFSRVPTVYSHGAVMDSLYRSDADTFSNNNDLDSRTDWDFINYLYDNNFTIDQPPHYSDVLLADVIENQVEYFEVPPNLPETPPPSYEEI